MSDYRMGLNAIIADQVVIEPGAVIGNHVIIHERVIIRSGAVIGDHVILGYSEQRLPEQENAWTEIGSESRIRSGAVIYWGVRLGNHCAVGHGTVIRERSQLGHHTYIGSLVTMEGDTVVGNYVGINAGTHITKYTEIGDYTFFGPMVISTNDNQMNHRRAGHGTNLKGFTTGKYVRIAGGATLLPGITLGEGSIVGAGSVVTRDVPPYKVVIGAPARVVKDALSDPVITKN